MDRASLCTAIQFALSANAEERKRGETLLTDAQSQPGQLVSLLQLAVDVESQPLPIRQAAAIQFKNMVVRNWRRSRVEGNAAALPFAQPDIQAVRDNLVEALIRSDAPIRLQLTECLKAVVQLDYPEAMPSLLPTTVAHLCSGDLPRIYGALVVIRLLARKYEFKDDDERGPIEPVSSAVLPHLLSVLKHLLAEPSPSLLLADYIKLVLKSFWSFSYRVMPSAIRDRAVFLQWMECFVALLQRPVPAEGQPVEVEARQAWPWWKVKKWLLHILNRLMAKFGNPKEAKADMKPFAELFTSECAVPLLQAYTQMLLALKAGVYLPERIINLALQFVSYSFARKAQYEVVKPHVHALLFDVALPLLCFNDQDEQLWANDPHEYVRKGYDMIADMFSARKGAIDFIGELLERRPKDNFHHFMGVLVQTMSEYQSSPPELRKPRIKDGALLAVGVLHEKLQQSERYKQQLEPMLVMHVYPEFTSAHGFLRAKAAWVASQYAEIQFSEPQHFSICLHGVLSLLKDPELPVRVDAVMALHSVIDACEDMDQLRPVVPQLLDDFFRLMNEVENEDLVFTLEVLVRKLDEEMAPYALGLIQNLVSAFWKSYKVCSSEAAEEPSDPDDDSATVSLLAAAGCLRAMGTVCDSIALMPQLFPPLEPLLLPVLQQLLRPEGSDFWEEALELATYLTAYPPVISPDVWSTWPGVMSIVRSEGGIDFFENALAPLDNFISRGTDHFLSSSQLNYQEDLFAFVSAVLMDETKSDRDVLPAPKLLNVVLQSCKGRVDHCLPPYFELVFARVPRTEYRPLKDNLALVIVNALHYNVSLTLQLLQQGGKLQAFLSSWLSAAALKRKSGKTVHFRKAHEKKVCCLGLTALLQLPPASCPPEVLALQPDIVKVLLQLLVAYNEQEEGKEDDDEDDEEEDGEMEDGKDDEDDEDDEDGDEDIDISKKFGFLKKKGFAALDDLDDDDDDDDFSDDDEDMQTALDPLDPFLIFTDTMAGIKTSDGARFQALMGSLDFAHQALAHQVEKVATEHRKVENPQA